MGLRMIKREGAKAPEEVDEQRARSLVESGAAVYVDGIEDTMARRATGTKAPRRTEEHE